MKIPINFCLALALLGTTFFTACQSWPTRENARLRKLQSQITESGERHIMEKMKMLKQGMSVHEVEEILGSIDHNYKTLMTALIEKRQPGMRITFENGENGGMHVIDDAPDGHMKSVYTYHGGGFTLVFDWNGQLTDYSVDKDATAMP